MDRITGASLRRSAGGFLILALAAQGAAAGSAGLVLPPGSTHSQADYEAAAMAAGALAGAEPAAAPQDRMLVVPASEAASQGRSSADRAPAAPHAARPFTPSQAQADPMGDDPRLRETRTHVNWVRREDGPEGELGSISFDRTRQVWNMPGASAAAAPQGGTAAQLSANRGGVPGTAAGGAARTMRSVARGGAGAAPGVIAGRPGGYRTSSAPQGRTLSGGPIGRGDRTSTGGSGLAQGLPAGAKAIGGAVGSVLRTLLPETYTKLPGASRTGRKQLTGLEYLEMSMAGQVTSTQRVGVDTTQKYGWRRTYVVRTKDGKEYETYGSPLVFDLDGDKIKLSSKLVDYDVDGDGKSDTVHDIMPGDGLLVFDADGDGIPGESGFELFGDNTDLNADGKADGFKDGFSALYALALQAVREKVLDHKALRDRALDAKELAELEEAYGLRMKVGGLHAKAVSLKKAGVRKISLLKTGSRRIRNFDRQGNDVSRQSGASFTRTDGSTGSYEDIWFDLAKKD